MKLVGRRAIVVGAGIGGLAAAKGLADCFETVLVLDRDILPDQPKPRKGTPQDKHVHGLLPGGQRALCRLFPGLEKDFADSGAPPLRIGLDDVAESFSGVMPRVDLGWRGYSMTRPLVEFLVRRNAELDPRITIQMQTRVTALLTDDEKLAVTGVKIETDLNGIDELEADLVVDASGQGELSQRVLAKLGFQAPGETRIGVDLGYGTALFEIPQDQTYDWKSIMTFPNAPQSARGGLIGVVEGDRWLLTVGGRAGDFPPDDWDEFMTYVEGLRTPTIYNVIKNAKPIGNVARYRFKASIWRHFERMERFPVGLLPFSDSICRFNPIYGQGMSVAALEALTLQELLKGGSDLFSIAKAFFDAAAKVIDGPWQMAAVPDFIFPTTQGIRPPDFMEQLQRLMALNFLSAEDPTVRKLIFEVQSLLKPPEVLQDREMLARGMSLMAGAFVNASS
jgi:2-polyprenyl-6-methoxyphenol hydroxylase-like FAD-dependent oxidoreductase